MQQLKVATRLSIRFGALLALVGVVAFVGLLGMARIDDTLKIIVDRSTQEMTLGQTMRSSLDQRSIAIRDMMLVDEKTELDSNVAKIKHEEGFMPALRKILPGRSPQRARPRRPSRPCKPRWREHDVLT